MLGYIIALGIGGVLLLWGLVALARGGPAGSRRASPSGPGVPDRQNPSADEPTPDRSAIASPAQAEAARRATPPA
jgi:hypothetical protein